jgi:type III pantothenate kinase
MLLVIDIGNTNTVLGTMAGREVRHHWRISTVPRTTDECGLLLLQLLAHEGVQPKDIEGVSISCVVPSVLYAIEKACRRYLGRDALTIGHGVRTGMRVRTDNPKEVGADRIVNAVAAVERYGSPLLVVDFGTATTFDCVNAKGDYVGGAIAPGYQISSEALFQRTAKLPKVELERPELAIGTNTIHSMQSGLFYGYVGLVEELARRCKGEIRELGTDGRSTADRERLGRDVPCIATGGLARTIGGACAEIDEIDDFLTLVGLAILWERNTRT